jgi:hypothetical protein
MDTLSLAAGEVVVRTLAVDGSDHSVKPPLRFAMHGPFSLWWSLLRACPPRSLRLQGRHLCCSRRRLLACRIYSALRPSRCRCGWSGSPGQALRSGRLRQGLKLQAPRRCRDQRLYYGVGGWSLQRDLLRGCAGW